MLSPSNILAALRLGHKTPAGELLTRLQVSRPTMMRALRALGTAVVSRGRARRTAYAARRALRGDTSPIPVFRIDQAGAGIEVARLDLTYPQGCALQYLEALEWPLPDDMADGWFEGIPYFLDDLRPQGFLGRQLARQNAATLRISEDPNNWSEDDALVVMTALGNDLPGCYVLGEPAYRLYLAQSQQDIHFLTDAETKAAYVSRAHEALSTGCLLYTSPSPRDGLLSRMPSSA